MQTYCKHSLPEEQWTRQTTPDVGKVAEEDAFSLSEGTHHQARIHLERIFHSAFSK